MSSLELFGICWIAGCVAAGVCELIRIKLHEPMRPRRRDYKMVDLWSRFQGWR